MHGPRMIAPYQRILSIPGVRGFVLTGFLARLPIAMLGIGIVLLVEGERGSYGTAGAVAATFGVLQAVMAPRISALVDRFGQARVMRPAIAIHVVGLVLLILTATSSAPVWTLYPAAALAGASMGSIGALVRARWALKARDEGDLHTAFSLESVLDELIFILGPVGVTLLATGVTPAAGLVVAIACALVGGFAFTALRASEPPVTGRAPASGSGVLRIPGMVVLAVTFLWVGGVFGSADVNAVAFTDERGRPGAAGFVLACFATGSMLSGLGYGAVQWRTPVGRRFQYAVLLLTVGVLPFTLATSIPALAAVLFVAGFAISPMIIAGNALVQVIVPRARLTEGLTWVATALGLGASTGAAISGQVIDAAGAHRAYLVTAAFGLLAAACALGGSRWLSVSATQTASDLSVAGLAEPSSAAHTT